MSLTLATFLGVLIVATTAGLCAWFIPEKHGTSLALIFSVGVWVILAIVLLYG